MTLPTLLLFSVLATAPGEILLEAEDATLIGVQKATATAGYSGSGYVTGFDQEGDRVEFQVEVEAGLYEILIGFATPFGIKGYDLKVNDISASGMFPATSGFAEQNAGKYLLRASQNSIVIARGWGWYHIDYLKIRPTSVTKPQKPSHELIDSKAVPSAQALISFLVDLYGSKVLSGQQDLTELSYIESKTGKTPAVGAFDLIEYSPSRIQYGADPRGAVEKWIQWAESGGGIVTLCWHWNAPTDLINQPGKEWWRGFYTEATTFDIEAVLAAPGSERYQLLLRDLDAIASQLKNLQDADIPVLWRPLHEASGGWFWWGAKGPEPFKKLWRLMVDRFRIEHGLHNLIWVYTHGDSDWYPGDAYVDVVSLDIYTDPSSPMSGEWERAQQEFGGRKLVTLSETGTLPHPDNVRLYATWWSWFAVWSGDFIRGADVNLLKTVYSDSDILTLDELPDWRRSADRLQFAQFADGAGLSSQLIISNDDRERSSTIYIQPRGDDGSDLEVDFNGQAVSGELDAILPPGGIGVFETDGVGPLNVGSVRVESTGPVSGVLIFSGPGLGLAGVGDSVPLETGFRTPVQSHQGKGIRTGVAVMNLEKVAVNCSFELFNEEGQKLSISNGDRRSGGNIGAPILGQGHFSVFVDELVWSPDLDFQDLTAILEVRSDGKVAATAIQTRPGQFATLPVTAVMAP